MSEATWRRYLRFWRRDVEADIDDELRFHFDERVDDLVRQGVTPESARATALAEFGSVPAVRDGLRTIDARLERRRHRGAWRDDLASDLRYAVRNLRRQPAFAAVVIATLALGIGANTAIFSVVDAVLLKPLPYRDPEKLVRIWSTNAPSKAIFVQFREYTRSFDGIAGYGFERDVSLLRECRAGEAACAPARVNAVYTSANLFSLLGVGAAFGRVFQAGDDRPGSDRIVLLSDALWRQAFGADPNITGSHVTIDGIPRTVIGVMPRGFALPTTRTQLWLPATIDASRGVEYWYESNLRMVGRLRPGVSVAQATGDVRAAAAFVQVVGQRVVVLRFVGESGHRAEVSDTQEPIRLNLKDFALVLVLLAFVFTLPHDRASRLPIRLDLGAEEVLGNQLWIGQRLPHRRWRAFDVDLRFRDI